MNLKHFLSVLLRLLLHAVAFGIIIYSLWPFISWYMSHRPILGVDFFNTATLSRFFSRNFTLLPNGFFDMWYAGTPTFPYAVIYWFYPIALIAKILPLVSAIKVSMSAIIILVAIFTYLAAYRLSQNQFLSILIAVLTSFSANLYGSLTWGGSLPYFANQVFFPLTLFLIGSYLLSGSKRWFWSSIITSGFAMYGHYGAAGAFILPAGIILLLFGERVIRVPFWQRTKETIVYLVVTNLLSFKYFAQKAVLEIIESVFSQVMSRFNSSFIPKPPANGGDTTTIVDGAKDIAAFYKNQVWNLYTDTHQFLFFILIASIIFFIVTLLLFPQRRNRLGSLAWFLVALYSFLHVFLNANGFNFLAQGWYRAFWHFPIVVGLAAAALIGTSQNAIRDRFRFTKLPLYILIGLISVSALAFVLIRRDLVEVIALIDKRSSPASAHPEAINLVRSQSELDALKNQLLPDWIAGNDRNFRLFTSDAQVNVWWNALFDVPLARGYLDAPGNVGYHFLLDQAVGGDDLVKNLDYPEESARNMAFYYIDWYAVKYGEGGHLSKSPNKSYSTYLEDVIQKKEEVGVKGAYILYETESGKPEIREEVVQYLNFYQFSDEIVSPVTLISDAPAILCICDAPTHESLNKIFSMNNINSRYLINAFEDAPVDSFSPGDLRQFDMVILANYRYRNKAKAFRVVKEYLAQGGNVIIDTGGETPESASKSVPDMFPFTKLTRTGLGREWDVTVNTDSPLTAGVDWNEFSPPLFDDAEWNFSYPGEVEKDAEVLVTQAGKPIVISTKSPQGGSLIWSGMNLAYHVQYYTNVTESKFMLLLLNSLVELKEHAYKKGQLKYRSSRDFSFTSPESGKGLLVKMQRWNGWHVTVGGKRVRSFAAGPSFPGFIYVPLKNNGSVHANFTYWGELRWYIWLGISTVTGLLLVDLFIFNGVVVVRHFGRLRKISLKKLFRWWEKEEG